MAGKDNLAAGSTSLQTAEKNLKKGAVALGIGSSFQLVMVWI
jgi:hypothetical protein